MLGKEHSRQSTSLVQDRHESRSRWRGAISYNRLIIFNRTCAAGTSWRWAAIAQI